MLRKYFTELKFEWLLVIALLVFIQLYTLVAPALPVLLNPEIQNLIVRLLKVLVFMNLGWISSYRLYSAIKDKDQVLYYKLRALHTAAFTVAGSLVI